MPAASRRGPEINGTFGVCATTHWIATAVGMSMLERGGNAFDAGVAAAFTLQVVEPHLCGPGGDVPVMVWDKRKGKPEVICGQGPAPAGATIKHYRDHLGLDMIPGTGLLAACIPGTFETFMLVLRDYGTMQPARRSGAGARLCHGRPSARRTRLRDHPDGEGAVPRALADIGGRLSAGRQHARKPGTLFRNPQHAETYLRILKEAEAGGGGREAQIERARARPGATASSPRPSTSSAAPMRSWMFRGGATEACSRPTTWRAGCRPSKRRSAMRYGNYAVLKPGPWTQGPVLLQMLAILKGFDLDKLDRRPSPTSSISGSRPPSSPTPIARRSTATRSSPRCRWRRCCRSATIPTGAGRSACSRRWSSCRARSTAMTAASSSRARPTAASP